MRALLVLIFVLALAVPAVGPDADATTFPPGTSPTSRSRDGSAQRKLDRARKRWRRAGIHNYRFQLTRQCFCPPETWVLFVRGDKPLGSPGELKAVATVRRLHRRIQDAIDDRVAGLTSLRQARDAAVHRPRPAGNVADDEVGYKVEQFWRGTRGRGGPEQ